MENLKEKKVGEKSQKSFSQVALSNAAIKVIDELINLEGSNRMGGAGISRADVLNDLLIRKGADRIREFFYSK